MSKRFCNPRDPWSFKTHFFGAVLSAFATLYLIFSHRTLGPGPMFSYVAFGLSLVALYSCSSIYHYVKEPAPLVLRLRKLDHSMIYVLIAGTYTPILVNCIGGFKGNLLLAIIWGVAALGIVIKVCWLNAPRWLYTALYLIMGWAFVFELVVLDVARGFVGFMLIGGILYSAGAVIYILKRPNFSAAFGFHEIFHVFILFGSLAHFVAIGIYI